MKSLVTAVLLPLVALTASAQTKEPVASRALLAEEGGGQQVVWILAATKTSIRYKETELATSTKDAKVLDFESIYFFEPAAYSEAKDLYQGRKYEEAKEKFAAMAMETVASTPEEFARIIKEEVVTWGKVVKAAGIKPR